MCAQNGLWSYHSHPELISDQTQFRPLPDDCATMDQTKPRPLSRRLCASDDLWSEYPQTKNAIDQTIFQRFSDHLQTIIQTIVQPWPRWLCASDDLWSYYPQTKNAIDQTIFQRFSDHLQTIVQTIVQPWPTLNPDHFPDSCSSQMISNQTIPKQKCHYSDTFLGEIWSGQWASLKWTKLLTQTYNSI